MSDESFWLAPFPDFKPTRWTLFDSEVGIKDYEEVKRLPDEYMLDLLVCNTVGMFGKLTDMQLDKVAADAATVFNVDPKDIIDFYQPMVGDLTIAELYTESAVNLGIESLDINYLKDRVTRAAMTQTDVVVVTEQDKDLYRLGLLEVTEAEALMRRQDKYNRFFGVEIMTPLGPYGEKR